MATVLTTANLTDPNLSILHLVHYSCHAVSFWFLKNIKLNPFLDLLPTVPSAWDMPPPCFIKCLQSSVHRACVRHHPAAGTDGWNGLDSLVERTI